MKKISISQIVAYDKNLAIGNDNRLLWDIPTDMKHFRSTTKNSVVIMGRKTYESIGRPLPNRVNIMITSQENITVENIIVAHSIDEAIKIAKKEALYNGFENIFIIGGSKIYQQTIQLCDSIIATEIEFSANNADAYYPQIPSNFHKTFTESFHDSHSNLKINISKYMRENEHS